MQLQFLVHKQYIRRMDTNKVVSGSKNYLEAYFMFSDDWNCASKTAVFSDGINCYEMIIVNNECKVPHEVIKAPEFTVSVFGGNLITTNKAVVNVIDSGLGPNPPQPPTDEIYNQILELANKADAKSTTAIDIAQSIEERAINGEFNGKNGTTFTPHINEDGVLSWTNEDGLPNPPSSVIKGPKGDKGNDGLTPYIGSNLHWWIGDKDTGYSAVVDESKIIDINQKISEIQEDVTKLEQDSVTTEEVEEIAKDLVEELSSEMIDEKISQHNEDLEAHKKLVEELNSWTPIADLLE